MNSEDLFQKVSERDLGLMMEMSGMEIPWGSRSSGSSLQLQRRAWNQSPSHHLQGSWGTGTASDPGIVLLSGDKAKTRLDQPQWGPGQGCGEEEIGFATALHGNVDLESD